MPISRIVAVPVAVVAGVGFLLFLTLSTSPAPSPSGLDHDFEGAARSCRSEVGDRLGAARFPFSANGGYLGDRRYRVNGTVESDVGGEVVRQNYGCVVQYVNDGYRADSIDIWRSH